jgi:hypothetical protein
LKVPVPDDLAVLAMFLFLIVHVASL